MQVKINRSDVVWSYISVIISLVCSVVTFPIVIFFLDGDMLGLWYIFASIGSITTLFDFGFTITFARNITYCWSGATILEKTGTTNCFTKEPDFVLMRDILYTCKIVYLVISLIVLLLLLSAGTCYILYVSKEIQGYSHIIAWIIYSIAAFLNLYYNYYDSFLRGVASVKRANQNRVYGRLIQLALMLVLLYCGYGILGLSVAYLSFGIVFRILGKHYFYSYQHIGERLKTVIKPIDKNKIKELFRTIWYNAWRDGVVSLSAYLNGQASVILCSVYLSLTETGIYSVGLQIANVVAALSTTLYTTYQPALQSNWVQQNISEVRRIMVRILFVLITFYIGGAIGVIGVGLPLLRMIKPDVIIETPILIGIFVSLFILKYRDCYTSYFSCTNRLMYMNAFLYSSVAGVLLSVILMGFLGWKMWGLVCGQIITQLAFNAWYWPYKANRELHLNMRDFQMAFRRNSD